VDCIDQIIRQTKFIESFDLGRVGGRHVGYPSIVRSNSLHSKLISMKGMVVTVIGIKMLMLETAEQALLDAKKEVRDNRIQEIEQLLGIRPFSEILNKGPAAEGVVSALEAIPILLGAVDMKYVAVNELLNKYVLAFSEIPSDTKQILAPVEAALHAWQRMFFKSQRKNRRARRTMVKMKNRAVALKKDWEDGEFIAKLKRWRYQNPINRQYGDLLISKIKLCRRYLGGAQNAARQNRLFGRITI
jgi:hypothetical protein